MRKSFIEVFIIMKYKIFKYTTDESNSLEVETSYSKIKKVYFCYKEKYISPIFQPIQVTMWLNHGNFAFVSVGSFSQTPWSAPWRILRNPIPRPLYGTSPINLTALVLREVPLRVTTTDKPGTIYYLIWVKVIRDWFF